MPRPPRSASRSPNDLQPSKRQQSLTKQRRHRMPTVALQEARRAVVAGDDEHRRVERGDRGHGRVELFDAFHLGVEVAVLAGAVGVFEVDEEEIVAVPVLA